MCMFPQAEAPALGQFLLPLLSADTPREDKFLIRHEDILQLLASAEETARESLPLPEDLHSEQQPDQLAAPDMFTYEEPPVTPEEEAALLHYVCEAERLACESDETHFTPVPEWLLGVYHSWCEISALMYTLVGTNMAKDGSVDRVSEDWVYRARFGCHCRLCLCLANNSVALAVFIRDVVWALAHGRSSGGAAAGAMRALRLGAEPTAQHHQRWDLPRLRRLLHHNNAASIIHNQLCRLALEGDITEQIVTKICLCRQYDKPMEMQ
ncbi:hypothetical protein O3G_MSEX015320 [Manduca sexta]|uniref:Uncharacterized protein n=1 Tax=Manduca sexta TaxID=7130 RepID=A0A921ZX30_MANSE|nr:hypothetical protein O3G_MSEX015320 [Manduca sexta]